MTYKNRNASPEYRKAIAARTARREAAARAKLEQDQMQWTTEGDFSHLAGNNTMKFRRG
ncbi:hypothetical protein [Yersinia phage vB_YenP_ISAO8]|uniref:Uncharacterized protein n=1 Tax=Yersinia phage vB_YenP_ISAO8 TaxID=1675027 RepID=A0A0H4U2B9_9CAUD|nr:hypothetical protein AVU16_gp06 [Yersinia phage vB_YenP_ISAO8]AKQ07676.1 hypothetical protein [Yersinia phage vB_YenP_ISAO8]UQT03807.1 hypothetical protein KAONASHI_00170 [Serratia phage vB_SmaP-Kaonashi]